ncbi:hypothetical protein GCM10007978_40550 [Shewanella hanedai]|uniref:Oligosaccharide repeat unit polymerase n=1 Tax=Shewanella hanedai TaxID=25 RepID=A0A553JMK2_SHEHA|nr:O-antigen polymerase [Shewanella hanedai]TRY13684.1 oligosaccharide repeat unit polymerase [Shewanella hanedai]GGI98629.1 hypothetical protein GCM10007978_40550 [Shewanella hanedai]
MLGNNKKHVSREYKSKDKDFLYMIRITNVAPIVLLIFMAAYGFGDFFIGRMEDVIIERSGFKVFIQMLVFILFFTVLTINRFHSNQIKILFIVTALLLVAYFPLAQPRFTLLGVLLAIYFSFVRMSDFNVKIINFLLFSIALVLVFPFIKYISKDGYSVLNEIANINIYDQFLHIDYDAMLLFMETILYLDSNDFSYGYGFLGVVFFFVPRAIWPEKPYGTSFEISEYFSYYYNNLSNPLPSELYYNFGIIGVVIGAFLFGRAITYLEFKRLEIYSNKYSISIFDIYTMVLYSTSVAFIVITLRGSLNAVFPMFGFGIYIPLMLMFFYKNRYGK